MEPEFLILLKRHDIYGELSIGGIAPFFGKPLSVTYYRNRRMQIINRWAAAKPLWVVEAGEPASNKGGAPDPTAIARSYARKRQVADRTSGIFPEAAKLLKYRHPRLGKASEQ